jgi:hypothetical protein
MCQDKEHGGQRCDTDTSEARRKRRKASKSRSSHVVHIPIIAGKVQPFEKPLSMEEIKAEVKEISSLLHAPCDPDPVKRDAIDAELEKRVTRLGLEIGNEVDRRANFNKVEAETEYESSELDLLREKLTAVREDMKTSMEAIAAHRKVMTDFTAGSDDDKELQRLKGKAESIREEMKELSRKVNQQNLTQEFDKVKKPTPTELRLSQVAREVLAEIRSVGGNIPGNPLSHPDAVTKMRETVGRDFPSAWIQASEADGELVIHASSERPGYNHETKYPSQKPEDQIRVNRMFFLEEERVQKIHALLTEDGDNESVEIPGHIIDNQGTPCLVLMYDKRIPFDASTDSLGKDGTPVGGGWKHGRIIEKDSAGKIDASEEKHWYRIEMQQGKMVPTISIPPISEGSRSNSVSYHEFCHRAEMLVGEKDSRGAALIERQEEAFLRRRTTRADGVREPLMQIGTPSDDIFKSEIGRPSDFMISYVGKEYFSSFSREVLSVGSEALFGNKFGSFHGLGGKGKEDLDHRGFTLGIFASA